MGRFHFIQAHFRPLSPLPRRLDLTFDLFFQKEREAAGRKGSYLHSKRHRNLPYIYIYSALLFTRHYFLQYRVLFRTNYMFEGKGNPGTSGGGGDR